MDSLTELKEILKACCTIQDRSIVGIWVTDCIYNPSMNGRVFKYKYIVVQTNFGQGCAYSTNSIYDTDMLTRFIGKDCLSDEIQDKALQVACMDSLANAIPYNYNNELKELNGNSNSKLKLRTSLILQEAAMLLGNLKGKKIINVGVVGDIINGFIESGSEVVGTDFDDNIIGKTLFDVAPIFGGENTIKLLKEMDLAVVTGMTITTDTIDDIIKVCIESGCKMIVFAETGANMGQYYVSRGIDVYLGEIYPFYIFNGKSAIKITRGLNCNDKTCRTNRL